MDTLAHIVAVQRSGQFAEARTLLESALKREDLRASDTTQLNAALADLHRAWAEALRKQYDVENAIAHYEQTITLDRENRPVQAAATLTALGELHSHTGRYDDAIARYEQALAIQREHGDRVGEGTTLSLLGESYTRRSLYEKAQELLDQALTIQREVQDRKGKGRTLARLGEVFADLSQYDTAQTHYEQALAIAQTEQDRHGEAEALLGRGGIYRIRSQTIEARTVLEKALAVYQSLSDRRGEAYVVNQIGLVYSALSQFAEARTELERALALAREVKDRDLEGGILNNLGNNLVYVSRYDQAITYFEQALAIARDFNKRSMEGTVLGNLGLAYHSLSRYDQAVTSLEQALVISREVGDRSGEGARLSNIGITLLALGQYERAIDSLDQALVILRETKARMNEGIVLNNLGDAYRRLSQYDKALPYYEPALVIAREVKDRRGESYNLHNVGHVYASLSQHDRALKNYESALAIMRELGDRHGEGVVLGNIGYSYFSLSHYESAIQYYERALQIVREIKNRDDEATLLSNIGLVYAELAQYEKAIVYYEQALATAREIGDREGEASRLNNLGSSYAELNQSRKAIEYFEQALAILREIKNRDVEGRTLGNLGRVYKDLDQTEKAIEYHEQALAIAREVKDRAGEQTVLASLGHATAALGRYNDAIGYHERALAISREIKDRVGEGAVLTHLMDVWKDQAKPRLAIFYGKQAVNAYQDVRGHSQGLPQEWQRSFLQSKADIYRTLADLLISETRLPEAQQVLDLLKTDEYFEFVRRDANALNSSQQRVFLNGTEKTWEQRYQEMSNRVTVLGGEWSTLRNKEKRTALTAEEKQQLAQLDTDLEIARKAFHQFLDTLKQEADFATDERMSVASLEDTQNLMSVLPKLGAGTAALYTLVGADKYRVIVITPGARIVREYPITRVELNRKVSAFRDVLKDPRHDPLLLAQELYGILLAPIAADLQGANAQTLLWSLDGALRYLPVNALHDGKQYMVEHYRMVVFTPASQINLQDQPHPHWRALGLGVSKAHTDFPPLFAVPEELHGIIREEKRQNRNAVLPGVVMLDEAFTQPRMVAALRKRYPVVHIASHFRFLPGNEDESYLLLGDGTRLSVARLKSGYDTLFEDVDLLVLSACETAVGGINAEGKEVEGFGVLAQRQGAKAVLATLWSVADASTKELMQQFYRNREAKKGISKAEALRQAQLALLHGKRKGDAPDTSRGVVRISHDSPNADEQNTTTPLFQKDLAARYAHPYYWAPFILIGNWR